ncbi:MAG TPA: hypothetical protein VGS60_12140 [Actinomycetes bacterium]|jgi:hypothetical protein|nr:hypothetical protein [Actinomycetes bacterium]
MPRRPKYADRIDELNVAYAAMTAEVGASYLDLWPTPADGRGALRPEFTLDKLHFTGQGPRMGRDPA